MDWKLALAGGALLTWAAGSPAQVIDAYAGVETYMRYCASCHGESARGDGPVAAAIPRSVPDLTRLTGPDGAWDGRALRRVIDGRVEFDAHGTRYMPVWGYEFWVEEGADAAARERVDTIVANLVDYLRSIQRRPPGGAGN